MIKKLLPWVFLFLLAEWLYAEDNSQTATLYLEARMDYTIDDTQLDEKPVSPGFFTLSRCRVGWEFDISEILGFNAEFDITAAPSFFIPGPSAIPGEGMEIETTPELCRIMAIHWLLQDSLTVTAGKTGEVYSPEYVEERFIGAGLDYDFGMGTLSFQAGNREGETLSLMPGILYTFQPLEKVDMEVNANSQVKFFETDASGDGIPYINADLSLLTDLYGTEIMTGLNCTSLLHEPEFNLYTWGNYSFGGIESELSIDIEDMTHPDSADVKIEISLTFEALEEFEIEPIIKWKHINTPGDLSWEFILRFAYLPEVKIVYQES